MAYCVHCGVKLKETEKRCPLCGIVSMDPLEERKPAVPKNYPVRTPEQELHRSKRFLLGLAAILMLGTAVLCLSIDFLLGREITWSVYPAGALALLFLSTAAPILTPRNKAYISLITAFFSLSAYLFLVEFISRSGPWFFPIVLPSVSVAAGLALLLTALFHKRILNVLSLVAACFFASAFQCLTVELFYSLARRGEISFFWSPFVLAPCGFIGLVLFFINGNPAVREEVRKRVFF